MVEVESCPRCGALPCDWTDNPHHPQPTGDVGALVEVLRLARDYIERKAEDSFSSREDNLLVLIDAAIGKVEQ